MAHSPRHPSSRTSQFHRHSNGNVVRVKEWTGLDGVWNEAYVHAEWWAQDNGMRSMWAHVYGEPPRGDIILMDMYDPEPVHVVECIDRHRRYCVSIEEFQEALESADPKLSWAETEWLYRISAIGSLVEYFSSAPINAPDFADTIPWPLPDIDRLRTIGNFTNRVITTIGNFGGEQRLIHSLQAGVVAHEAAWFIYHNELVDDDILGGVHPPIVNPIFVEHCADFVLDALRAQNGLTRSSLRVFAHVAAAALVDDKVRYTG